jgi:hypothetical protein
MRAVDDDLQAQRAQLLLVCVQVLHGKPTLVAHWLACAGSVKIMMMIVTAPHRHGVCNWSPTSACPLMHAQRTQGVLASFFYKFADSILKKYSSTVATIATAIMSFLLFGHALTVNFLLGLSIVCVSMHQASGNV